MTFTEKAWLAVLACILAPHLTIRVARWWYRRQSQQQREAYWKRVPRRTETFAEARERKAGRSRLA